jgi:hypothetical protein
VDSKEDAEAEARALCPSPPSAMASASAPNRCSDSHEIDMEVGVSYPWSLSTFSWVFCYSLWLMHQNFYELARHRLCSAIVHEGCDAYFWGVICLLVVFTRLQSFSRGMRWGFLMRFMMDSLTFMGARSLPAMLGRWRWGIWSIFLEWYLFVGFPLVSFGRGRDCSVSILKVPGMGFSGAIRMVRVGICEG